MRKLNELTDFNFVDTISIPDGYDLKYIPDLTRDNFNSLIEEHNRLVKVLNAVVDKLDINIEDILDA